MTMTVSSSSGSSRSGGGGGRDGGATSVPAESSRMIVFDREGELYLREKSFFGSTRWQKYYAVLCRLRHCLLLFSDCSAYDRHLAELNRHGRERATWRLRLPLHHSSAFVCSSYFSRPHVFEIDTPSGIFFLRAPSERSLRDWLTGLSHAGAMLKSDEKALLLYRPPGLPCFLFTRTSSTLPAHDPADAAVSSWESLAASQQWNVAALMRRAILRASPSPQGIGLSLSPGRDIHALLGRQFSPDLSYGKHGYLQKLGRSLFAGLLSDANASADPTSPFYDPRAALEQSTAAAVTSPYNRWLTRFYRTAESASGRACLVSYRDREQTQPSGKRKHVLQLFDARVFDLAAIRAQVEEQVRVQAEADERERWRRKAETRGAAALLSTAKTEENIYANERGPQRRARAAALSRAVQQAFVSHRSFPEPLPDFSPSGEADFAIYVRTPQPKFLFFRASTSREKVKWIGVLRNLAADQPAMHRRLSVPSDSPMRALVASSLAPPGGDQPPFDEREVYVSVRDLYAILGVEPDAPTQLITKHYRELQAELRARLMPTSPLHAVVPTLAETNERAGDHAAEEDDDDDDDDEENGKEAGVEMASLVGGAQPPPRRHQRVFSFDVAAAPLMQAMAAGAGPSAAAASSSSVVPAGAASSSASAVRVSSPLSVEQVQQRIRFKLNELREVWRILKDPVRRCQYDERREALGLAELGRSASPPPGSHLSPDSSGGDGGANKRELRALTPLGRNSVSTRAKDEVVAASAISPGASAVAGNADGQLQQAQALDLDLVLRRAQQSAETMSLALQQRSTRAASVSSTRGRRSSALAAAARAGGEMEEKYPAAGEVRAPRPQPSNAQNTVAAESSAVTPAASSAPTQVPSPPSPPDAPPPPPPPSNGPTPSLRLVPQEGAATWAPGGRLDVQWEPHSGSPGGHARLELMRRGFLSRVSLVHTMAESAPDTGSFSFVLPSDLPPRRTYFVRLTLLPREDAPVGRTALVTTESPPFEVVPLAKP